MIEALKKLEEENLFRETFSIPRELAEGKIFRENSRKNIGAWIFSECVP